MNTYPKTNLCTIDMNTILIVYAISTTTILGVAVYYLAQKINAFFAAQRAGYIQCATCGRSQNYSSTPDRPGVTFQEAKQIGWRWDAVWLCPFHSGHGHLLQEVFRRTGEPEFNLTQYGV
jgi:hypothetical protein